MLDQILQAFSPVLHILADHLIELILVGMFATVRKLTGVQIDEKHRLALHSAALTGVKLAIETGLSGDRARDAAVKYVRASVPDAVKRLTGGSDTIIGQIVQSKLSDAIGAMVDRVEKRVR